MKTLTKPEKISNANSKGSILDYYGAGNSQIMPKPSVKLSDALKTIKNDPVVTGSILSIVDKVLETPTQVINRSTGIKNKEVEDKLYDLRFSKVLRKVVFSLILYGNVFIEIIKKDNEISDLNVLETSYMDIEAKDNGDVTKYVQRVNGAEVTWKPDRIIHIKLNEFTSSIWAEVDIQAVYETVLLKESIRNWIYWFFKTNQARGFYNIKNANKQKVSDFLANLKANERNLSKPVIAQGEVTYQILRNFSEEGATLKEVLEWCDGQILALLQIPPIVIGFPDQSGRSNSVEQFKSYNTRILNIQRVISEAISHELLVQMDVLNCEFSFAVVDTSVYKSKFETAKLMKDIGLTNESITEWLKSEGIVFNETKPFNEVEVGMNDGNYEKKGEGEPNKQLNEVSTRDNQLVANSQYMITPSDQWKEIKK